MASAFASLRWSVPRGCRLFSATAAAPSVRSFAGAARRAAAPAANRSLAPAFAVAQFDWRAGERPVAASPRRCWLSSSTHDAAASSSDDPLSPSSSSSGGGVFSKIAFIGAGKMAEAMISPLISTNIQPADRISVYDVSNLAMDRASSSHPGVRVAQSIPDCIDDADLIVLAVKPQNVEKVYAEIRRAQDMSGGENGGGESGVTVRPDTMLLSIIAGTPIESFTHGTGMTKVARSMPNTPAQIGRGVTVWSCTDNISKDERSRIKDVLCCFGKAIYVDDESFIDMSTSISGSGPAYIFLLMEAMIDAGVHMGFSRDTATTLVHHTLLGSTLYAMETGEHPAILRNSVTSPAGTTASAVYELERGRFRVVIKDAIWACYRRSLEMGGHASNVGPGRTAMGPPTQAVAQAAPSQKPTEHHPVKAPSGEVTDVNGK